jgi:hypothetical protein
VRPADGERSAVVGLSGQYHIAARIVLAKLTTLEWIRVADPAAGVADDFQFQAGPTRHALQVKWAQYPGSFGWAELVNPSGDMEPLLGRLAQAWQRLRASWPGPLVIHLRSNEHPAVATPTVGTPLAQCTALPPHHFAAFLSRSFFPVREQIARGASRWTDVDALPEVAEWRAAWDAFQTSTGLDGDHFVGFVKDLSIHFGPPADDALLRPDHAPADADLEHLATTLQALVADPARPVQLSRAELLDRVGWSDRLRYRHPHAFPVPTVYAANQAARTQLQNRLRDLPGGYVALVGPAGSGKSTLLASLNWPGQRVVRYYAFVPDAPDPLSGRGEADSFLHDLALALEEGGLPRSGYGNDLRSQRAVLQGQLDQAGRRWHDHGEATVIVVDGLDHIPREQDPTRSLLEELPALTSLSDGVFVILGTQTTSILPAPVRDAVGLNDRTVDLPPLSAGEVGQLADAAGPGYWLLPGQRERLVTASEGHPLALTYLLQELNALELGEPDLSVRHLGADALLDDASAYGREVEARYRGYFRAAGTGPELLELLGAVARLRAPVDLRWLATWADPHALTEFERRTATFFRRHGSVWHFIHNSFRRFLADETARLAGQVDPGRDRRFHIMLADTCANSGDEWLLYRDEELAHRFLAGQHDRVLALATPARLRAALLQLRPPATVRDHALIALRAAASSDEYATYLRMLLFLNELWQRQYVLDAEQLAATMIKLDPARALEHVVGGSLLRVSTPAALESAARLIGTGQVEAATQVLRAAGGLAGIIERGNSYQDRDLPGAVADWAEATLHLSGPDEVIAQLDDHLPLPAPASPGDESEDSTPSDSEAHWEAERSRREQQERAKMVIGCRNLGHARCFDVLTDLRDEAALTTLLRVIDAEASPAWQARARVVRAIAALEDGDPNAVLHWIRELEEIDSSVPGGAEPATLDAADAEEITPRGRTGAVPLSLRLEAAELLVRAGFVDAAEVDRLVPPGTGAVWSSVPSGRDGLEPFHTLIALWRLREVRPDPQPVPGHQSPRPRPARDVGNERFRGALRVLARLEGQYLAATIGRGHAPLVAAQADPIVRLLEVPQRQASDWTGWYAVRDAVRDLLPRLVRLAAVAGGPGEVARLLDRFIEAWTTPERASYWAPSLQQVVLGAALATGAEETATRVREWLGRLDAEINARASDVHDRAETWLTQADVWRRAGDLQRAENAVRTAIAVSFGPGIHDNDRQLISWLDWLRAAADGSVLSDDEFLAAARSYASRLVVAAGEASTQAHEAAERLLEFVWPTDPALTCALAESLCDTGVVDEVDAIRAVLVGAARDPRMSVKVVAGTAAELLLPILQHVPTRLAGAIEERGDSAETQEALNRLAAASAVWSVPDERGDDESARTPTTSTESARTSDSGQSPTTARALLAAMREASDASATPPGGWAAAVDQVVAERVSPAIARALIKEASRLRLEGETIGGLAAMAAQAGESEVASAALADALARAPAYGWISHTDGGSRLKTFRAALRDRHPALVRLAAKDLAGVLVSGAISGQLSPDDLRRIAEVIAGTDVITAAWPDVAAYLDVFAPAGSEMPDAQHAAMQAGSPVEALLRWVTGYLGHPVRPLDFGARRTLQLGLQAEPAVTQRVLADAVRAGGWTTEAALHTLVTSANQAPANLSQDLATALQDETAASDAICRDLARRLASRYQLPVLQPTRRRLAEGYYLALPPLPERTAPELDAQGIPHLDPHDPQQLVAPFDLPLRLLAARAELDDAAVLHRAASIAVATDEPWIRGGHRAHAARLRARGQLHTYRPWAYMAGRRALGSILAGLADAGALGTPPALPAYYLGLVDETLIHVEPTVLDASTPAPWRRPATSSYNVRAWSEETEEAANTYAAALSGAPAYVLAEHSDWRGLEWGRPEETRIVQVTHGVQAPSKLLLPPREAWELTFRSADAYPDLPGLDWTDEELVMHGVVGHSDARWLEWFGLHPSAGYQLGWLPDDTEPFAWQGPDGNWRARTIRRARGQLSHRPPARTYCAEVWQIVVSDAGLADLRSTFGSLTRTFEVKRTLPAQPREGRMKPEHGRARVLVDGPQNAARG